MKAAALATAVVALGALSSEAQAGRFALVVGANAGDPGEQPLRYAEADAHRFAEVLRTVGHFAARDVVVLASASAADVRKALADLDARVRQAQDDSMLLVFYSGHADSSSLHLGGTRFRLEELRDAVAKSTAATRLLVIDACQSGALTRAKGGRPGPGFAAPAPLPISTRGMAILASSSALEDAQESEKLKSSFFTHYFISALRGAADSDRDGQVTLGEAYAFTSERTLAATSDSRVGPQHPTYRFDLAGHGELVLSQVSTTAQLGALQFSSPGEYFVKAADGVAVAEVEVAQGAIRRVVVAAGRYQISRRSDDHLLEGSFEVRRGVATAIEPASMSRVAYAQVVRKGGTAETSARSVYTVGGVRGSLLGMGVGWTAGIGGRIDLSALSLELRVQGGRAQATNDRLAIDTREMASSVLALRAIDLRRVTLGVGIEAGGFWLAQRFSGGTPDRDTFGAMVGPITVLEVPMGWWYARAEAALLTYVLRVGNETEMSEVETPLTFRGGLGVGAYF